MAESREKENEREHEELEDEELDEALEEDELEDEELDDEEELDEAKVSQGDAEGLTISERRARRKARRRKQKTVTVADEDAPGPVSTAKQVSTRSQKEAMRARERQAHARGENIPVIGSFLSYLRGVSAEMQKVTWPTQEEARRLTMIVLAVTLLFSIFLGAIDIFYGWWFEQGITDTGLFLLVGIPFLLIGGGLSWFYILRIRD